MVGIRGRLLALALGVGIPLAVVGLTGLQLMWSATRLQVDESLKNQAAIAATIVDRWIAGQQQPLTIIARGVAEGPRDQPLSRADLKFFASTRPHWLSLRVSDASGVTVFSHPNTQDVPFPAELSDYLQAALLNKPTDSVVAEWRVGTDRSILAIGQAVDGGGAVIALVDTTPIQDLFRQVDLPDGCSIVVFDPAGHLLFQRRAVDSTDVAETQWTNLNAVLGDRPSAIVELQPNADTAGRIAALARVGTTGCTLLVGIPSARLYEPARAQFDRFVFFSLVAIMLAVAGSFFISRGISIPLQRLREAATRLGKGDLTARAPVRGSAEMVELGMAFNTMASSIEERDAQLTEIDRLKSEFIGSVSHELRTPLTTIKTLTRVLQRGNVSAADQRSYLDTIAAECDRQIDLVLNLLDLTRIEAGAFSLTPKRVDVTDVVQACVVAQRHAAEIRNHEMRATGDEAPVYARADRVALRRIICSLIENSVKYTPDGGRIEIAVSRRGGEVLIRVSDSGVGIRKEDIPRIFEKFYRGGGPSGATGDGQLGQNSESHEIPGVGLGLYLVKTIVMHLGGTIEVESERGRGSTFTIRLAAWSESGSQSSIDLEEARHVETSAHRR